MWPPFRQVYDREVRFVWRALRYLGVPRADVDDAMQDVFVVVHRKLGSLEQGRSVRSWIYGICVRVASDRRKRAHVRREVPSEAFFDLVVAATQHDALELDQARTMLCSLLDAFDEQHRTVFVLHEIEG